MKRKSTVQQVVHAGTHLKNITITVQPESDAATERRAEAVKSLAGALQANAEALGSAAEALRGPANETTGIKIEGAE